MLFGALYFVLINKERHGGAIELSIRVMLGREGVSGGMHEDLDEKTTEYINR